MINNNKRKVNNDIKNINKKFKNDSAEPIKKVSND
jgi:hypothetical protein